LGAGRPVEKKQPISDRILLRRRRQFVHEAFCHKDIVRRPDAAPEGRRNARRLHPHIFDVQVREGISQIDRALGVETIVEPLRKPSRDDRSLPLQLSRFLLATRRRFARWHVAQKSGAAPRTAKWRRAPHKTIGQPFLVQDIGHSLAHHVARLKKPVVRLIPRRHRAARVRMLGDERYEGALDDVRVIVGRSGGAKCPIRQHASDNTHCRKSSGVG